MVVLQTDELWLLCGRSSSVVAMWEKFEQYLWNDMMSVAVDLYAAEKPPVPTRLHPITRHLREATSAFSVSNSSILCEVPLVFGLYGTLKIDPDVTSPYAVTASRKEEEINLETLNDLTKMASTEIATFFTQAHTALWNQTHEVIVFMITEKNRIQHDSTPYAYPLAYALKGKSMGNADLRYLVTIVRAELRKRGIPILCEVYDGQWQQFITSDAGGRHLTKLQSRNIWNKIAAYSKNKCLEEMSDAATVKCWDLNLIRINHCLNSSEQACFKNVTLWKNKTGNLFVESRGGQHFDKPVISKFVSVTEQTRPDLFPLNSSEEQLTVIAQIEEEHAYSIPHREIAPEVTVMQEMNAETEMQENLNTVPSGSDLPRNRTCFNRKRQKKGLQPGERDLLCLLDKDMVKEIVQTSKDDDADIDGTSLKELANVLLHPRCDLLQDIHAHLIYNDTRKWSSKRQTDIYPDLLTNGDELMKQCTVAEIKTICGVLEHHTKRKRFVSTSVKAVNVNILVRAFGSERTVPEENTRHGNNTQLQSPEKLSHLTRDYLKKGTYEKIQLTVALGSVVIPYQYSKWL